MSWKIITMDENDKPVERRKFLLLQNNLINLERAATGNYIVAKKVLDAAKYNLLQAQAYMAKAEQDFAYWKQRMQLYDKKNRGKNKNKEMKDG